jgi:hypothetical protein
LCEEKPNLKDRVDKITIEAYEEKADQVLVDISNDLTQNLG